MKSQVAAEYAAITSRSREGAWIEILSMSTKREASAVAPVRERGLKSIWVILIKIDRIVAPVRERGLKFLAVNLILQIFSSLL